MVFFSSCAAVQFYNELLNFIDLTVQCIHVSFFNLIINKIVLNFVFFSFFFRVNKNNRNEPSHFFHFVKQKLAFYCVLMWLLVV